MNEAGIPSVVIGGVAVGTWGNPRVTRDVDLKVLLGRQDADRLLALLSPDYVSLLPDPHLALRQQALASGSVMVTGDQDVVQHGNTMSPSARPAG